MAGCQPDIPYVARFLCPVPDIRHWEAALHFTEWRGMTPASKDSEGNVVVKYISPTLVYIAYTSRVSITPESHIHIPHPLLLPLQCIALPPRKSFACEWGGVTERER